MLHVSLLYRYSRFPSCCLDSFQTSFSGMGYGMCNHQLLLYQLNVPPWFSAHCQLPFPTTDYIEVHLYIWASQLMMKTYTLPLNSGGYMFSSQVCIMLTIMH